METSIKKINNLKYNALGILIGISALFASCAQDTSKPGDNYSENGANLSKKALNLFKDLNTSIDQQNYNDEFIKILNDVSPETYLMKPIENEHDIKIQYLYASNALKSLEKAFNSYHLQLDSRVSANEANLKEKMLMACNALDSIRLNDATKLKLGIIKKNVGSGKYRVEGSLFQLTDIYSELWNEIAKTYLEALIKSRINYENGIKKTPVSAFNAEKIKTIIDEPYNNSAVLVNLFKLKLIKDNQEQGLLLESKVNNISEAFNILLQIQGELMKRKKDKLKIQDLNNNLEILIAQD